jgi:hypothetical protein
MPRDDDMQRRIGGAEPAAIEHSDKTLTLTADDCQPSMFGRSVSSSANSSRASQRDCPV